MICARGAAPNIRENNDGGGWPFGRALVPGGAATPSVSAMFIKMRQK